MILGFEDYRPQGQRLAQALELPYAEVDIHRFPDGESKVTLPEILPSQLILCRSLDHPNDKLIELMLTTDTARQQGVEKIILVAPYLCYMRQDIAFHPGEAVSQKIIGQFFARHVDAVVTVDPHLHRIDHLEQAIPIPRAISLSATEPMRDYISRQFEQPLLLGPDAESRQWVRAIAEPAGLDYGVASKERLGDRNVHTQLPKLDYKNREVIIVDDMVSTGRTLISVAAQLQDLGADSIHCLVTHALFSQGVMQQLHDSGIESIHSTDSVTHPSNALHLAPLLAEAVKNAG